MQVTDDGCMQAVYDLSCVHVSDDGCMQAVCGDSCVQADSDDSCGQAVPVTIVVCRLCQ